MSAQVTYGSLEFGKNVKTDTASPRSCQDESAGNMYQNVVVLEGLSAPEVAPNVAANVAPNGV
jgi:hypothetical protein